MSTKQERKKKKERIDKKKLEINELLDDSVWATTHRVLLFLLYIFKIFFQYMPIYCIEY